MPQYAWDRDKIAALRSPWWDGPIAYKSEPLPGILKPQELVRIMRRHMTDDDLFVSDASLASGWIGGRWQTRVAGRRFFAPRGLAGLGWGLPAAIGVSESLASRPQGAPSRRGVCLAGGGGGGASHARVRTPAPAQLPP